MKPFDLKQALAGAPVITRGGEIVDEVIYSKTILDHPIFSIAGGYIRQHNENGAFLANSLETEYDLFMAPTKREGWLIKRKDNENNLLSTMIFDTEEAARLSLSGDQYEYIKIEWEE